MTIEVYWGGEWIIPRAFHECGKADGGVTATVLDRNHKLILVYFKPRQWRSKHELSKNNEFNDMHPRHAAAIVVLEPS